MSKKCVKCTSSRGERFRSGSSFISTFFIILIPKCPFCIMAYSSAISMCGGQSLYLSTNNWVSYIPLALSGIIMITIIANRRGRRTIWAFSLASIGLITLIGTHQLILPELYYNVGTLLLFLASWINGNFLSFISFILQLGNNFKVAWQK